jgi:hypothetical protein
MILEDWVKEGMPFRVDREQKEGYCRPRKIPKSIVYDAECVSQGGY